MKKLEHHKAFPIVAWALIFSFAFFTYNLSKRVSALEAERSSTATQQAIDDLDGYFENSKK